MRALFRHELSGSALIIWNCNSKKRNALSSEYYEGLSNGLAQASSDQNIAAVILAGESGFFCSGGDLTQLQARRDLPIEQRRERVEQLNEIMRNVRNCSKPVIAAVEGGAAGAGLSLALSADLIVASDQSKFTMAYVKAGLVPDGGATYSLMQSVPRGTASWMAMLGEPMSAERLFYLGVVSKLVKSGEVMKESLRLVEQIGQGPQVSTSAIKALLNAAETATFEEQLATERDAMAEALGGEEARVGIKAFLQKEKPVFS